MQAFPAAIKQICLYTKTTTAKKQRKGGRRREKRRRILGGTQKGRRTGKKGRKREKEEKENKALALMPLGGCWGGPTALAEELRMFFCWVCRRSVAVASGAPLRACLLCSPPPPGGKKQK